MYLEFQDSEKVLAAKYMLFAAFLNFAAKTPLFHYTQALRHCDSIIHECHMGDLILRR